MEQPLNSNFEDSGVTTGSDMVEKQVYKSRFA